MGQRSTSRSINDDETLVVGQIRGPHGVRGEVRIDPRTDIPGRFVAGAVFGCEGVGPLKIVARRGAESEPIVRFEGHETRESVEAHLTADAVWPADLSDDERLVVAANRSRG